MGQHYWLLLATIPTEILVITEWSRGQFEETFLRQVKWAWLIGGTLSLLYPTIRGTHKQFRGYTSFAFMSTVLRCGVLMTLTSTRSTVNGFARDYRWRP